MYARISRSLYTTRVRISCH